MSTASDMAHIQDLLNYEGIHRRRPSPEDSDQPSKKPNLGDDIDVGPQHRESQPAEYWSWPKRVDEIASKFGDCLACTDDRGKEMTWSELVHKSKVVAAGLRKRGFTATPTSAYPSFRGDTVFPADPMVIMMEHTTDAFAVLLGILRQGFPLLPLSITHADKKQLLKRYSEAMELFQPAAILSDSEMAQHLMAARPGTAIISPAALLAEDHPVDDYQDVGTTLDNALAYIFTSGSSGQSKCVTATNRMAWAEMQWYPELFKDLGVQINPRKDRWRQDHEMGWWGAAYFGEIDVALAMQVCIVMMKPNDANVTKRGVTMMGALPSQLQNLWPGAKNTPETLRVIISWAERCDVDLGLAWKRAGVKMADLLIATEFWLSLASRNLEAVKGEDGRAAHAMRVIPGAKVVVLDDKDELMDVPQTSPYQTGSVDAKGMLGISGPQVSPGYVELLDDGRIVIGSGEKSMDAFKWINGEWTIVPKDIVKKRSDGSFLSVGRGGGLVKLKGGVLVATNVVEQDLQQRAIAAACITDPVHVQGGSCVALEINWVDEWSLRDSLQQASFLRMPILYKCQMPRNQSTGKVQKSLLQEEMVKEHQAEMKAVAELRHSQNVQLDWYLSMAMWALLIGALPALFTVARAAPSAFESRLVLVTGSWLLGLHARFFHLLIDIILNWCYVAWAFAACAHAGRLGVMRAVPAVLVTSLSIGLLSDSLAAAFCTPLLISVVVAYGVLGKHAEKENPSKLLRLLMAAYGRSSRLVFAGIFGLAPRTILPGSSLHALFGFLCIVALGRCLPAPCWSLGSLQLILQRFTAHILSFYESVGYMMAFPTMFVLGIPSIASSQHPEKTWKLLKEQGKPLVRKQVGSQYAGPQKVLSNIYTTENSDGTIWIDIDDRKCYWDKPEVSEGKSIQAATPVGARAQVLARQAGVDFLSVDSLRIARLSVLLKKHLKPKNNGEPLEFGELRDACSDEQSFVSLMDQRMEVAQEEEMVHATSAQATQTSSFLTWARGGSIVHREGATQAPWDCQVDVTLEWQGALPIEREKLNNAFEETLKQHPLLRVRKSPDAGTDALMGDGRNCFSTTVAGTWNLVASVWADHYTWNWRIVRDAIRPGISQALWMCWPRTIITCNDKRRQKPDIHWFHEATDDGIGNVAGKVHNVLGKNWYTFWNDESPVNICVVELAGKQYLYCSITHQYADGGAAAAFAHSLREHYDLQCQPHKPSVVEHPILKVHQERLQRYLRGDPCPEGSLDVYLFDINGHIFQNDWGHSLGVYFSDNVCNTMRMVGLRVACSEEIAWLICITCSLCRLLPDEELIKILIVHNGRIGDAEGGVACTSQYVTFSIPCANLRSETPLADIASRVKFAIAHGKFTRPAPSDQFHARINLGGEIGKDGDFQQLFKEHRSKKPGWSRATYILQLRMDSEGGNWKVKDYKCHQLIDSTLFWQTAICVGLEIADGWFTSPLSY
mmetsp:Transcript_78171/g.121958  ORF Transcript_78171/g.121958 Transcript_78171/m.121958 type:complete len:1461 (+) Transcript_78171:78-4460(+)